MHAILKGHKMDYVDEQQAREETDGFEYNPNIAIQQAQRIQSNTRKFGDGVVTDDQVKDEMQYSYASCTEIKMCGE